MARCENCNGPHAQLHHAIPKSILEEGRNEPLNFIRLCHACHIGWHQRSVTIYRTLFSGESWKWISERMPERWLDTWYPPRPDESPF